jgi:hypothetical protein
MVSSAPAHQQLLAMEAGSRVAFVESRLLAWIAAARSAEGEPFDKSTARPFDKSTARPFDGATHLSDLGIDSLQLVDIKFELDELVGRELDVSLFIRNPTIGELARECLRACGL